jgi:DNA-binding NarL/FixJ family response regulator
MIRILICDDHALVRKGLKQLLAEAFPSAEFRESATIPETQAALLERRWDILVLDLFMPGGSGLSLVHEVCRDHPFIPVLVLSSAPEEQLGIRVLRAGASGFLNKQSAPERLVQAVRKILEGGKYISSTLAEQFALEAGRGGRLLHENLSAREYEVFQLVVAGRSLKEIAGDLSLSVKTVRTFRARVLEKLHLQSDVDLVHYALDQSLVEKRVLPPPPGI